MLNQTEKIVTHTPSDMKNVPDNNVKVERKTILFEKINQF